MGVWPMFPAHMILHTHPSLQAPCWEGEGGEEEAGGGKEQRISRWCSAARLQGVLMRMRTWHPLWCTQPGPAQSLASTAQARLPPSLSALPRALFREQPERR